ncbi:MAG TPA: hypothetical protein VLX92_28120 [Kofleriaceae bacterium]|nr:hypothetical protein [Kofleriaceae bacterium]
MLVVAACHHADPPVEPGTPLPAEPDLQLGSMDDECKGLDTALASYGECPNLDDQDRAWIKSDREYAEQSMAAGKKGFAELRANGSKHADEIAAAERQIALACHKAASSVHFATVRCQAGPKPKTDY